MSTEKTTKPGGVLAGAAGVLMVLCCVAGPAVIGAVAGASVGGLLGIGLAVIVAVAVSVVVVMRRRRQPEAATGGGGCGC